MHMTASDLEKEWNVDLTRVANIEILVCTAMSCEGIGSMQLYANTVRLSRHKD